MMCNFLWGGVENTKKIHRLSWDVVTLPKKKSGLGITPLKHTNIAILSKWWWRFRNEKHKLWWNTIWSIHYNSKSWTPIPVRLTYSGVWRNIFKIGCDSQDFGVNLNHLLIGILGNGKDISLWANRWVTNAPLMELYPAIILHLSRRKILWSLNVSGYKVNPSLGHGGGRERPLHYKKGMSWIALWICWSRWCLVMPRMNGAGGKYHKLTIVHPTLKTGSKVAGAGLVGMY